MTLEEAVVGFAGAGLLAAGANSAGMSRDPALDGAALVAALVAGGLGDPVKACLEAVARDIRVELHENATGSETLTDEVTRLTGALNAWSSRAARPHHLSPDELASAVTRESASGVDPDRARSMLVRLLVRIALYPELIAGTSSLISNRRSSGTQPVAASTGGEHGGAATSGPSAALLRQLTLSHDAKSVPMGLRQGLLAAAAETLARVCERLSVPAADAVMAKLQTEAVVALREGQLEDADTLLAGAAARHIASIGHVATPEAQLRRAAAELWGHRAAIMQARLEHRKASQYYASAASVLDPADAEARWLYAVREGTALNAMYEELGDVEALGQAIIAFARALQIDPSDQRSDLFALTHNCLGNCLLALAERERSPEKLELAIKSYRSALAAKQKEPAPREWALLQSNLGMAAVKLGEMTNAGAPYEEAVVALGRALEVFDRQQASEDHRLVMLNLGVALARLGARSRDETMLRQALQALGDAAQDGEAALAPELWVKLQAVQGDVYGDLGDVTGDPAWLERAVAAFRKVVDLASGSAAVPSALAEANLGSVLWKLGHSTGAAEHLAEARSRMGRALAVLESAGAADLAAPIRANLEAMTAGAIVPEDPDRPGSPFEMRPGAENEPVLRDRQPSGRLALNR